MKFLEILCFEFSYQLRRPWVWLFFVILIVLNFLMTRDASLSEALYDDFIVNSPFAIAKTTVFGTLIWLVMAGAIAGEAAARDHDTRMSSLIFTVPITKLQYLGGRFLAALLLNTLVLLAVQIGILFAIYAPGVDVKMIGPFRPIAFLTAYAYISIPNAIVATALQFSLAAKAGRPMAAYFGSILLVFMGFFVASLLLFNSGLGTLLDPIGIRFIIEDIAHLWTSTEKSWRLLQMEGIILTNRAFWLCIAGLVMLISFSSFKFAHRHDTTPWWSQILKRYKFDPVVSSPTGSNSKTGSAITVPTFSRNFNFTTHIRQARSIGFADFKTLVLSWPGRALLIGIPLLTLPVIADQMESGGGVLVPTTIRVIAELTGQLSDELSRWVIIPAFIIYFAGELVWKEREARLGDIFSTIPGSSWAPMVGKFLALILVMALFTTMQMIAGIIVQSLMDYYPENYFDEIFLYVKILFGLQLTDYMLFAVLAIVIHVLINQKYMAHIVAILAYVFIAMSTLFGIDHHLLVYGAAPTWSYTEMRGFADSLTPWFWFKLYWTSWALLLATVARLFWVRTKDNSFKQRLRIAASDLSGATALTGAIALTAVCATGTFIFYNTNILNKYLTSNEQEEKQAQYELLYGKYKSTSQPTLTRANLKIDIHPFERFVNIQGAYHLINHHVSAVDTIVLTTVPEVETREILFNREVTQFLNDDTFGHRVYVLKNPLKQGDSIELKFDMHIEPKGFREDGVNTSITANATFFTNSWLPVIGYQSGRELINASERRKYNLPTRPLIASLYDKEAVKTNGEGIILETVVSTTGGQVAGAPGAFHRMWSEGDRHYFHYSTGQPIGSEWTFFSGKYAILKEEWHSPYSTGKPVTIRIFHQPQHTDHISRMIEGIRASLDYYTKEFGPYSYEYLSVVEKPGQGTGLHADASMLTYSEGFALWNAREGGVDFPFAIIAHEVAHQWTVPYANVEGAPVLSESVAWYYGLKAVENKKGVEQLRDLLSIMRQPHPIAPIRRGEPLLRGLDKYMSYRRGPFALYTLSEYIGDDNVNRALKNLLENHRAPRAPLATTLDLYRELQNVTPDSLEYLLHDLFEVNTYWELETVSVMETKLKDQTWKVTLEIDAKKIIFDSAGVETEVQMNDWIPVALFKAGNGQTDGDEIYLQKHLIRSGTQKITVTVQDRPVRAGIDPYHLLIDLNTDDNIKMIKLN